MKSLYKYSLSSRCAILIGISCTFLIVSVALNWIRGIPLALASPVSIINALIFPVVLLSLGEGGEPDVTRRRRQFAFAVFVFCGYLLSLASLIYIFGFPASRGLFTMPITTTLLILPFAVWRYCSSKSNQTPNAG